MKPHIKRKQGQFWIWSSLKASKDCMPQHKCSSWGILEMRINQLNK